MHNLYPVILTIGRREVLDDVKQLAFVEGDIMEVSSEHARHQVFDIGEDGNVDRVSRVMDTSFARCVEACYPYSKEPVGGFPNHGWCCVGDVPKEPLAYNDMFRDPRFFNMKLLVPAGMSKTSLELLVRYVHDFMVAAVMADWLGITKPDAASKWSTKADQLEDSIKSVLSNRCGRVRRKLCPF